MEKKCQVDDIVYFSDDLSHGLPSSTGENKVSAISSERVHSGQQTSYRSDLSSEAGPPINEDRKDSDAGRAEVSQGEPIKTAPSHHDQLKSLSSSSKESGDPVQFSCVDSIDPKPCESSNLITAERNPHTRQDASRYSDPPDGSLGVLGEPDSSHTSTKADPAADSMSSKHCCNFDLNEGMEANGAECPEQSVHELKSSLNPVGASEPIPVVAKVGVPVGLPKKPLQFGGELGWRTSATSSAFRPTILKNSDRENGACGSRQSLASQGIDLNIAFTMDSELCIDEASVDVGSKQTGRFPLDLNCQGESGENCRKQRASGFDLNDNPGIDDTCNSINEIGEQRQVKHCIGASSTTGSRGSGTQPFPDTRRPSYWVDLSSMPGMNHVQSQPILVAAPTAEQVRMVVPIQSEISFLPRGPSGLHVDKVHSISPTFYPPGVLTPLNSQHPSAAVVRHLSGPVLAAYPGGAFHVLDSPQMLYPAYATPIRPTFAQSGSITLVENVSRGASNVEFLVPVRNALYEERTKPVERVALPPSSKRREPDGGWDYSQVNYRPMASWNLS